MAQVRQLDPEEIDDIVEIKGKLMENGEERVRISDRWGELSTCITRRETAVTVQGWQDSHRHSPGVTEIYGIAKGWLVLATLNQEDIVTYQRYEAPGHFVIESGDAHNVYVPAGALFATIKLGGTKGKRGKKDWTAAPKLDRIVMKVQEADFGLLLD